MTLADIAHEALSLYTARSLLFQTQQLSMYALNVCIHSPDVCLAVSAVHDGYVLQKSITRSPLGGSLLTSCLLKAAEAIMSEKSLTIRPRYSIKRVQRQPSLFEVSQSCCVHSAKPRHVHQFDGDVVACSRHGRPTTARVASIPHGPSKPRKCFKYEKWYT